MASAAGPQSAPRPSAGQPSAQQPSVPTNNEPFDVLSQDMAFPTLPGAAKHQASKPAEYQSKVPELDASALGGLSAAQRTRLQTERDSAQQMDQQLHQVGQLLRPT